MGMNESVMEELARYNKEVRLLSALLQPFLFSLATVDLELLQHGISSAETVASLLTPSEYMHGGVDNLEQQRKLIEAVIPLVTYAKSLLPPKTTKTR